MAVVFIEPGGDAHFGTGIWPSPINAVVATDFVHGGHQRSIQYTPSSVGQQETATTTGFVADSGYRASFYVYFVAMPTNAKGMVSRVTNGASSVTRLYITSAGNLQMWDAAAVSQIGSNGSTLSTGQWYRITIAATLTSTTVNRFEIFVNGVSDISITNATLTRTGSSTFSVGTVDIDATYSFRGSDTYIDSSNSLTDTGDIWVTAKRPVSNGTTNDFNTQIGAGGSGYGSGHTPQVNERPRDTTNGWSIVNAGGSTFTEEYTIEGAGVGDIDISHATLIDFMGWVYTKALTNETAQIVVSGSTSNITISTAITIDIKMLGSSTYPAGGTDIGIVTSTTATTVSLYEAGIIVAYTPGALTTSTSSSISTSSTSSSTSTTVSTSSTSSSTSISTSSTSTSVSTSSTSSSTSKSTSTSSTSSSISTSSTSQSTSTSLSTSTSSTSTSTSTTVSVTTSTSSTSSSISTSSTSVSVSTSSTSTSRSTSTSSTSSSMSTSSTSLSTSISTSSTSASTSTTTSVSTSSTSSSTSTTVSFTTSTSSTSTSSTSASTSSSTSTTMLAVDIYPQARIVNDASRFSAITTQPRAGIKINR